MPDNKPVVAGITSVQELESGRKDQRKFKISLNLPITPAEALKFLRTTTDIPKVGSRHPQEGTTAHRFSIEVPEGFEMSLSQEWIVTISYKW